MRTKTGPTREQLDLLAMERDETFDWLHQRGQVQQWDGTWVPAWVCPCCGTAEPSEFLLNLNHGRGRHAWEKSPEGVWATAGWHGATYCIRMERRFNQALMAVENGTYCGCAWDDGLTWRPS